MKKKTIIAFMSMLIMVGIVGCGVSTPSDSNANVSETNVVDTIVADTTPVNETKPETADDTTSNKLENIVNIDDEKDINVETAAKETSKDKEEAKESTESKTSTKEVKDSRSSKDENTSTPSNNNVSNADDETKPDTRNENTTPSTPSLGSTNTTPSTPTTGSTNTTPSTPATGSTNTTPSTPSTGSTNTTPSTPATGSANTTLSTPGTGSTTPAKPSNPSSSTPVPSHTHTWTPQYVTKHIDEKGHYENKTETYTTTERRCTSTKLICLGCGGAWTPEHLDMAVQCMIDAGIIVPCLNGCRAEDVYEDFPVTKSKNVVVWVVDTPAHDAEEISGYSCSCGATK